MLEVCWWQTKIKQKKKKKKKKFLWQTIDSRAVLVKTGGKGIRVTEDHKPQVDLIDWLIDWFDWLIWLIDWLICLIVWLFGLIDGLIWLDCLIDDWLIECFFVCFFVCCISCIVWTSSCDELYPHFIIFIILESDRKSTHCCKWRTCRENVFFKCVSSKWRAFRCEGDWRPSLRGNCAWMRDVMILMWNL